MVKFGKFLKSVKQTKWGKQYFNYKGLKDLIKESSTDPSNSQQVAIKFFGQMDQELNKVLNFVWPATIDLKTSLASLSSQLPAQIETLVQGDVVDSANDYAKQVLVHAKEARELVLFLDVNLVAIHKVMKKFNKKMESKVANEYVQAKCGSELEKLWDLSLLSSIESDLEMIASKLTPRRGSKESHQLVEPLLRSSGEQLKENAEQLHGLVGQIHETLHKLATSMPLERYMAPVPHTGIFDVKRSFLSTSEVLCVCILMAYWANIYEIYGSCHEYALEHNYHTDYIGTLLAVAPFFGVVVTLFHGGLWTVDYKLPLLYCILINAIGNALYRVATPDHAPYFMLAGRVSLGLGDPTILVLLYLASSIKRKVKRHWEFHLVSVIACASIFTWLIQTVLGLSSDHFGIGSEAMFLMWLILLVPFLLGFQSSPMYRPLIFTQGPETPTISEPVYWSLLYIFVPALVYEVHLSSLVTNAAYDWLPSQFLAISVVSAVSLLCYMRPSLRDSKGIIICSQILGCIGSLVMLTADRAQMLTMGLMPVIPQCLMFSLMFFSFIVALRGLNQSAKRWDTNRILQVAYLAVLAGRVVGNIIVSLMDAADEEGLVKNSLYFTLTTCGALGVVATGNALRLKVA